MRHTWTADEDGQPVQDEIGYNHWGVFCRVCYAAVCVYCHSDWRTLDDCPGEVAVMAEHLGWPTRAGKAV